MIEYLNAQWLYGLCFVLCLAMIGLYYLAQREQEMGRKRDYLVQRSVKREAIFR